MRVWFTTGSHTPPHASLFDVGWTKWCDTVDAPVEVLCVAGDLGWYLSSLELGAGVSRRIWMENHFV